MKNYKLKIKSSKLKIKSFGELRELSLRSSFGQELSHYYQTSCICSSPIGFTPLLLNYAL